MESIESAMVWFIATESLVVMLVFVIFLVVSDFIDSHVASQTMDKLNRWLSRLLCCYAGSGMTVVICMCFVEGAIK